MKRIFGGIIIIIFGIITIISIYLLIFNYSINLYCFLIFLIYCEIFYLTYKYFIK
jgi:hypothetical protein